MPKKPLHAGWFRCRIRGKSKSDYPWIYFHVSVIGAANELFREARYYSGLYLHRQIFDCERILYSPKSLTAIKTIFETVFHYQWMVCPECHGTREILPAGPSDAPVTICTACAPSEVPNAE